MFAEVDIVYMSKIAVVYVYNASDSCQYDGVKSNSIINANCTMFSCKNPMMFLNNNGIISIDNIMVDTDIDYGNIKQQYDTKYHYFYYEDDGQYGWITNKGMMNISNANISNTICRLFIWNTNQLSISDMKFTHGKTDIYNPNDLHSYSIITQQGFEANLYVEDGHFVGSYYGLGISSGGATIINCSFQQMSQAMDLYDVDGFEMRYSKIKNNGMYNGPFLEDGILSVSAGIVADVCNNIIIFNTVFSGFDPNSKDLIY